MYLQGGCSVSSGSRSCSGSARSSRHSCDTASSCLSAAIPGLIAGWTTPLCPVHHFGGSRHASQWLHHAIPGGLSPCSRFRVVLSARSVPGGKSLTWGYDMWFSAFQCAVATLPHKQIYARLLYKLIQTHAIITCEFMLFDCAGCWWFRCDPSRWRRGWLSVAGCTRAPLSCVASPLKPSPPAVLILHLRTSFKEPVEGWAWNS